VLIVAVTSDIDDGMQVPDNRGSTTD